MTSTDGTPAGTPDPSSNRLSWATLATVLISIVAVVILSLTHNTEAAATVGSIGTAITVGGGVQLTARRQQ
ncbi:hypothetical protein [Streptomyces sp. NPDC001108]